MPRNKGQLAEGFVFWLFYLALTGADIYFIMTAPAMIFSRSVDTQGMENAIFSERAYASTAWQSPLTARAYPGILPTASAWDKKRIVDAFSTAGTPRRLAFKLALGSEIVYFPDEMKYNDWKAVSPVFFRSFVETRPVWIEDQKKETTLTIDQVYTPKPPRGESEP